MQIKKIEIRRFRSINSCTLDSCGAFNVLIGKNNAGKSNILKALELLLDHLRRGAVSAPWRVRRPIESFTDRATNLPIQIAVEFILDPSLVLLIRKELEVAAPQLSNTLAVVYEKPLCLIVSIAAKQDDTFIYLEQVGFGELTEKNSVLDVNGLLMLSVPSAAAAELMQTFTMQETLNSDIELINSVTKSPRLSAHISHPKSPLSYMIPRRIRPDLATELEAEYSSANTAEEFQLAVLPLIEVAIATNRIAEEAADERIHENFLWSGKYCTRLHSLYDEISWGLESTSCW
jgi:energy-coupling factor transporter ATP-binding protein EcfA2